MHHPVGEFYLIYQIGGPSDRQLLRVPDIVKRVQYVLDHPIVAIKGECALEHDRGPVHNPGLHPVTFLVPEIDVHRDKFAATLRATAASPALDIHEGAVVAGGHMVDDRTL